MTKKEMLKRTIEKEREKLDRLVIGGLNSEEVYEQALVMDHLMELYMDCE